jgi:hypothetical protein
MPKELERKLRQQATQKGLTGARADRFVFGTMTVLGKLHAKGSKQNSGHRNHKK